MFGEQFVKYAKGIRIVTVWRSTLRYSATCIKTRKQVVVVEHRRILDHIRRNTLDLSELQFIVLDEADEMLRMGFIDDVETVMAELPEQHNCSFSATMPEPIRCITKTIYGKST